VFIGGGEAFKLGTHGEAADLVLDSGSERKLGVRALLSKKNFRWRA
jgi:hypothetical protein